MDSQNIYFKLSFDVRFIPESTITPTLYKKIISLTLEYSFEIVLINDCFSHFLSQLYYYYYVYNSTHIMRKTELSVNSVEIINVSK